MILENGRARKEETFKNGEHHGLFLRSDENGNLVQGGHYRNGKKIGSWTGEDKKGNPTVGFYCNDELIKCEVGDCRCK